MTVTWPATPDTFPKPGAATKTNDTGFFLDEVITDHATVLERLESVASGELFINSNYDHWQRVEAGAQACPTTFNAITSYGPDRIFTLPAGAAMTITRAAAFGSSLPKSRFVAGLGGAASVTTVDHGQRIRSAYRGSYKQPLVFGALLYNDSGASFTPTLRVDTPATADVWTTPTNRLSSTLQACPNAAWTLLLTVFDPSAFTNIDNGLAVYVRVPSGSLTAGKSVYFGQMSLRPGVGAVPYLAPDPEVERLRSLPYYRKSYSEGVALQTNTSVGLAGTGAHASGGANWYITTPFSLPMWKIPTVRLWSKDGTANQFYNPVLDTNNATINPTNQSTTGFEVRNASTPSEQIFFHYDAVAELT